jgi:hypothetical protein
MPRAAAGPGPWGRCGVFLRLSLSSALLSMPLIAFLNTRRFLAQSSQALPPTRRPTQRLRTAMSLK